MQLTHCSLFICLLFLVFIGKTNAASNNDTTTTSNPNSLYSLIDFIHNESAEFVQNLTQPLTDMIDSFNISSVEDLTSSIIDKEMLEKYKQGLLNSTMVTMIRSLIDSVFNGKNSTETDALRKELGSIQNLTALLDALNISTPMPLSAVLGSTQIPSNLR